jgi:hypothetical protein
MGRKATVTEEEVIKTGTERFDVTEDNKKELEDLKKQFAFSDFGTYINIHWDQPQP